MFDIDIDIEEIEKIKDPNIKFVVNQLKLNGFAVTQNNDISRKISKKLPEFRKSKDPIIIMGPDRYCEPYYKMFCVNPTLIDPGKELERFIKKIIKKF